MLTAQNRHHDALAIANQAVQILKRLALTEPDTHEPDLAQSLNNLSVLLTVLGAIRTRSPQQTRVCRSGGD
jgi:hypothetical protein